MRNISRRLIPVLLIMLGLAAGLLFFNSRTEIIKRDETVNSGVIGKIQGIVHSGDIFPQKGSLFRTWRPSFRVSSEDSVPRIAIIIDDFGYSSAMAEELATLAFPVTWSIIPYLKDSQRAVEIASDRGIPYLIHMPMQAFGDEIGGPYLIGEGMNEKAIREHIRHVIEEYPGSAGMNNHRGSKATSSSEIMAAVMDEISKTQLVFVDSRTASSSVAYDAAVSREVPALSNGLFLDNSPDLFEIASVFEKALDIAESKGQLVIICHVRPSTVEFLKGLCTNMIDGVEFVTVLDLLGNPLTGN